MHATSRPATSFVRLLCVIVTALGSTACITIDLLGTHVEPLGETVVHGDSGPKILLVDVEGVIRESAKESTFGTAPSEGAVARLREELDRARQDDEIRALLLRINSPGGTVTGSDLIYQEILDFKEERGVPVIAQMMGMATSGGYYVALAADQIRAHRTTVTGSIGVIFTSVNLSGLLEKIGVKDQSLTSGDFKDAGSMLREMRPEERAQLQTVLDDMYRRFLDVVQAGRPGLEAEQIERLADGRIYSADQALEHGLVDAIGSLGDSIEVARKEAGLEEARVVRYHRASEYQKNIYTRSPLDHPIEVRLLPDWHALQGPAFQYLWAPGAGL